MPKRLPVSQELGLVPGKLVLDYILEEEIGEGGMGAVWRARHQYTQRSDAIKFISKGVSNALLARFRQEAVAAARVRHQNVTTTYAAAPWSTDIHGRDMFAIAMELMSGSSLDTAFPKDLISTLDIFLQIVQGLIAINNEGIVHRDLKPQNIFVEEKQGPTGELTRVAKIGDFGIAQLPDTPFGVETTTGTFFGTMFYAPPEQIRDTSTTDARSDLYSLGLIFWQVLGQTLTFPQSYLQASDKNDLIAAKQQLPEAPSVMNPAWNIPPQLDDLVLKLLQPNPAQRFQTAREVYETLKAIQTSLSQRPVSLSTTSPQPQDTQLTIDDVTNPHQTNTPTELSVTDVMRSRSVDAVRKLFTKLGYPTTTEPLTIDPSLWYAQSHKAIEQAFWITNYTSGLDTFGVILFELNDLSAGVIQSISRDLLRRANNWLFVAAKTAQSPAGETIYERLLFIVPQRGATPDRPRLLRLAIDIARPTRHTLDVLRDMALPDPLPLPSTIYAQLLDAFNVEVITKRFYRQYARLFRELVDAVRNDNAMIAEFGDVREVEGFVQRLLGRLMFLSFLQKKGWLAGDQAFLTSQFGIVAGQLGNYYRDFLVPLFFRALALPENERNANPAAGPVWSQMDVPFLNGGLFEVGVGQDYELDQRLSGGAGVYLDNRYFTPDSNGAFDIGGGERGGILAFFNRYEFTVEEDTPEDIVVSLDPEMLGKVFEELITERHETGSYYTPRPVVTFMCREALKGLLQSRLPRVAPAALAKLVDEHDPADLSKPTRTDVIAELRNITVCDPACGSGAYLLGMLHELLALRQLLVRGDDDARSEYDEKLDIIERNIYGVDADPIAVSIARLRLWLSLIVDFNGVNPPPLPNLDYKIMIGDSLVEKLNGKPLVEVQEQGNTTQHGMVFSAKRAALQAEFEELRRDLFGFEGASDERRTMKERLLTIERELLLAVLREQRDDLDDKERDILARTDWVIPAREKRYAKQLDAIKGQRNVIDEIERQVTKEQRRPVFPWNLYFSEVFQRGGFDIMLANPPYVRADAQYKHVKQEVVRQDAIARWQNYRAMLLKSGDYETLYEKWDLYIPFLERAFQKLRPNGQMIFIIPDAYNAAKYTQKSHKFFLERSQIMRLDFCSEIPIFEGVSVWNTILHFAKAQSSAANEPVRVRRWGKSPRDFEANTQTLPTGPQQLIGKAIFRYDREQVQGITIPTIPLKHICYISKGMVIHADERHFPGAFKTDDVISAVKDKLHPKPFIQGRDIAKWVPERIQYLEWGTTRAPSMFRRPTFPELYSVGEKLITMDIGNEKLKVTYDNNQLLHNHSASSVVLWQSISGVRNKSIRKTAKYKDELKNVLSPGEFTREDLENLSGKFSMKYIVAIMNSTFARTYVNKRRKSKVNIYPDDWKPLPIAAISLDDQQPLIDLVDHILNEFQTHGHLLPNAAAARVAAWEQEIDAKVYAIYDVAPNDVEVIAAAAPTDLGETNDDEDS